MALETTPTCVLGGIVASISVGFVTRTCILPLRDVVVVHRRPTPMLLSLLSRGLTKTSHSKEGSVPVTVTIWVDRGGGGGGGGDMSRGNTGANRLRTKQGKVLRAGERAKTGVLQLSTFSDVHPEDAFLSGLSHDKNNRVRDDFLANYDVNNEVATICYTLCIRRHHPEPGRLGSQGEMIPVLVKISLAYRCHLQTSVDQCQGFFSIYPHTPPHRLPYCVLDCRVRFSTLRS